MAVDKIFTGGRGGPAVLAGSAAACGSPSIFRLPAPVIKGRTVRVFHNEL